MTATALPIGALILAAAFSAQEPATPVQPTPSPAAARAAGNPDYAVGAGDLLEITVFGHADLSRDATVQPAGTIALPLLGEVQVAGLSVLEIQRKLTTLLERDYLVNPQVEIRVKDYQSQFVIVLGEVNSPGRKPLRGRTRLIDALVEAGGFKPTNSGEVTISRSEGTFEGGAKTISLRFGGGAMSPQDRVNLEVALRNGDLITVAGKDFVTLEGEVARPGRYAIEGEALTVTGALSLAGGPTRFAANDVKVRRTDPQTGKVEIVEVDLKAVREGRKADVPVLANDTINVPRRRF